jgi:NOL1/NOP2/fmu family ribosome biogenesis protein
MGKATVHTQTLQRAAAAIGGEATLARALEVEPEQARRWLSGDEYPPTDVYHKALDLLIGTGGH